ncbi:MAG: response regulator transcription factor [Candidatus Dormibacteraeota bacterium]|nr:response regulator transcription factor [Candidatus Dormibacteraeota bacterium]
MTTFGEPTLRVLVIEDQTLLRRRLIARLAERPAIRVVGEGGDGLEAHRLTCMYRPDGILLDATLPDSSCATLVERLHERFGALAIVVLHPQHTSREARSLLASGARAVISKEAGPESIESALRGHVQRIPAEIFSSCADTAPSPVTKALPHRLTERELTVLLLVAKSASNRQIATQLEIREKTVRNHIWHLSAKLGLTRRRDAAEVVASLGLTA